MEDCNPPSLDFPDTSTWHPQFPKTCHSAALCADRLKESSTIPFIAVILSSARSRPSPWSLVPPRLHLANPIESRGTQTTMASHSTAGMVCSALPLGSSTVLYQVSEHASLEDFSYAGLPSANPVDGSMKRRQSGRVWRDQTEIDLHKVVKHVADQV